MLHTRQRYLANHLSASSSPSRSAHGPVGATEVRAVRVKGAGLVKGGRARERNGERWKERVDLRRAKCERINDTKGGKGERKRDGKDSKTSEI